LTTVATVPINLEYGAWFAVIDPTTPSNNELISLHDHLLRKPWFLCIEEIDRHKCCIITTKPNLTEARAWVDANLEVMVRKSIPEGIDPPSSQLPRCLDKPVYSASSQSYADVLKKQFSIVPTATTPTTANNRPPINDKLLLATTILTSRLMHHRLQQKQQIQLALSNNCTTPQPKQ